MDVTRFRSFAERYVIERANTFKVETEMEDAWNAVERAKAIYKHIENVAMVEANKDLQGYTPAQVPLGATGMGASAKAGGPVGIARRVMGGLAASPSLVNSQAWTGRKIP